LCQGYEKNYNNVKVIHQENAGVGSARNTGLSHCKGDWITFVDADDYVSDSFYKIINQNIRDAEEDVILFEHQAIRNESDIRITGTENAEIQAYNQSAQDLFIRSNLCANSVIPGCHFNMRSCWAKVFRKDFLMRHQLFFDEGVPVGEDQIFMLKAYSCFEKVKCVCLPIYYYVFNENSITNRYKPGHERVVAAYKDAFESWSTDHQEYIPYYMNCRLGDIMFYLKYEIFHKNNKQSTKEKKKRMKLLISEGEYPVFYQTAKENHLLREYKWGNRLVYWLAIHDCYYLLKLIFSLRYQ
jgi:glycosyltransferase involved in cell wall biosynthesis